MNVTTDIPQSNLNVPPPSHTHTHQLHQNENSHQHLHLQPGRGRRSGHHHHALPEHRLPAQLLAVWRGGVQSLHLHRLLQHVHQHLDLDHDERGPLRGRVPPHQGAGFPHARQGQDHQRDHLVAVVGRRHPRHDTRQHEDQ